MDFVDIPPTTFPKLLQYAFSQTLAHLGPFEDYLRLCEFIQQVGVARSQAVSLIGASKANPDALEPFIHSLRSTASTSLGLHRSIFALYMVGAYNDASKLVEESFQNRNSIWYRAILDALNRLDLTIAKQQLHAMLKAYASTSTDTPINIATRVKKPGSLFAKLISTGELDLAEVNKADVRLEEIPLPYDLVGGQIIIESRGIEGFKKTTKELVEHFASNLIILRDQMVYSPEWMGRKSFVGKFRIKENDVPFQLHVWDQIAQRYEWLSYGNYKMNKLFCPVISNWKDHLTNDLNFAEYATLVRQKFQRA
jgi:hypothetical protein